MSPRIPGRLNDRRTPLGELNWIFTAITDTIAWNVLPRGEAGAPPPGAGGCRKPGATGPGGTAVGGRAALGRGDRGCRGKAGDVGRGVASAHGCRC